MITINLKHKFTPVFNLIFFNRYVTSFLSKISKENSRNIRDRLYRAAILADTLSKLGAKPVTENNSAEQQVIALLTEAYFFQLRIIYDNLFLFLPSKKEKGLPKNFSDIIKKIRGGKSIGLPKELVDKIKIHSYTFDEIRGIRNAIKDIPLNIIVKNNQFIVITHKYQPPYGSSKKLASIEKSLLNMIFDSSIAFYVMLAIIEDSK